MKDTLNLTIDIGNSYIKVDLFNGDQCIMHYRYEHLEKEQLDAIFKTNNIHKVIVSSVRGHDATLFKLLSSYGVSVLELTQHTPLPIKLGYRTPQTLGKDRIAAIVGAWSIKPNSTCLVIDIGTCITYDYLSAQGVFEGGNIAPGWKMRIDAMHHFTHTLPQLEPQEPINSLGTTTQEAMQNGAYYGIVAEINETINKLKLKHTDLQLFLTGGDASYFEKQIKNCIFAFPNLVPIGLNQILKYNERY